MAVMIAAGIGAVGSLAGSLLNKPANTSTSQSNTPFGPQANALTGLYPMAQNTYDNTNGNYTGATYSPINDTQKAAADQASGFASGTGAGIASTDAATAGTLQGAATPYVANANQLATGTASTQDAALKGVLSGYATGATPVQSGVSAGLSSALDTAATNGAGAINNFNTGLTNVSAAALADPSAKIAGDASTIANGGYSRSLMDATNADINHTLGTTNATSDQNASVSGNLNSSRQGALIASNDQAAARQIATSDATIGNAAYNQGVTTAAQQNTSGLNTAAAADAAGLNANGTIALGTSGQQQQQGQFGTTTQIGAANTGLTQNLGTDALNTGTNIAGNSQLGTATSTGLVAGNDASAVAGQNATLGQSAGGLYQNDANASLADQYAQWQRQYGANSNSAQALAAYAKIVQQGYNGASTTNGTQTVTPASNPAALALGGASAAGGLYSNYQNNTGIFANNDPNSVTTAQSNAAAASQAAGFMSAPSGMYGPFQPS